MRKLKLVVLGVLAFLLLIVILQNTSTTTTRLLWLEFELPRAFLLALCLLGGFGIGYITCTLRRRAAAKV